MVTDQRRSGLHKAVRTENLPTTLSASMATEHPPRAGPMLEASLGSMNTIPTETEQVIKCPKLLIVSKRVW